VIECVEGWHYHLQGTGDRNMVIVPGLNGRFAFFQHQLPTFSSSFRLLLFELPELPAGGDPEGTGGMEWMADELYGVMQSAGMGKATIIGESFGGTLALIFAIRHPECVESLVVISTVVRLRESLSMRASFQAIKLLVPLRLGWTLISRLLFCRGEGSDVRRFFIQQNCVVSRSLIWRRWKELRKVDLMGKLEGINAPALIIDGMKGLLVSYSDSEDIHNQIRGSRKELFEGAGHLPHLTRPDRFNSIVLEFLDVGDGTTTRRDKPV